MRAGPDCLALCYCCAAGSCPGALSLSLLNLATGLKDASMTYRVDLRLSLLSLFSGRCMACLNHSIYLTGPQTCDKAPPPPPAYIWLQTLPWCCQMLRICVILESFSRRWQPHATEWPTRLIAAQHQRLFPAPT
jgi:hypothetical protein